MPIRWAGGKIRQKLGDFSFYKAAYRTCGGQFAPVTGRAERHEIVAEGRVWTCGLEAAGGWESGRSRRRRTAWAHV